MGIFSKLFNGLKKTKENIANKLNSIFVGELNDEFYEDLELLKKLKNKQKKKK